MSWVGTRAIISNIPSFGINNHMYDISNNFNKKDRLSTFRRHDCDNALTYDRIIEP